MLFFTNRCRTGIVHFLKTLYIFIFRISTLHYHSHFYTWLSKWDPIISSSCVALALLESLFGHKSRDSFLDPQLRKKKQQHKKT